MTTALTLLITAMQLLTMVANTPNLSVEFKNNAIQIANQAIAVAQDEIAKSNTAQIPQVTNQVTQTVTQPVLQTPVFSSIISNMEIEATITDERQPSQDNPNGVFGITVRVKDGNVYKKGVAVTMSAQDQNPALNNDSNNIRLTDTQSIKNSNDWSTVFLFNPTSAGDKDITFTHSNVSKTLTINAKQI